MLSLCGCNVPYFNIDGILPLSSTALYCNRTTLSYLYGEMWYILWYILLGSLHNNNSRLINWILRVNMMPTWLSLVTIQVAITCGITSYYKVGIKTTVFSVFGTVMCKLRRHIDMGLSLNPSHTPNGIFHDNFINIMAVYALNTCRSSTTKVLDEQNKQQLLIFVIEGLKLVLHLRVNQWQKMQIYVMLKKLHITTYFFHW